MNDLLFEVGRKEWRWRYGIYDGVFIREPYPVRGWSAVQSYIKNVVVDVYNSVYGYEEDLQHPVVDRLAMDFDYPCNVAEIDDILCQWKRTVIFSGNGVHFYVHTKPIKEKQYEFLRSADSMMKRLLGSYIDENVYMNPRQMMRSVGSRNRKTGLHCISLQDPKMQMEDIRRIARNSSGKIYTQEGDLFEWPGPSKYDLGDRVEVNVNDISIVNTGVSNLSTLAKECDCVACPFTKICRTHKEEEILSPFSDYKIRFYILLFMKDCLLLSPEEARQACSDIFGKNQINKINSKGQLRRVYEFSGYNFRCDILKREGICPADCKCDYYTKQAEFIKQIAKGEMDADDAEGTLAKIQEKWSTQASPQN